MIGQVLSGRYKVAAVLAQGGTSQVLLCEDLRLPGTRWAVKLAEPRVPGVRLEQLFATEAQLLARLQHRALPTLVDRLEHEGRPALVMDAISGQTLAARLEKAPLPVARALTVVYEVARLLDYLHQHSVYLVDLNPANLLLDDGGSVRVVDLGLALQSPGPAAGGVARYLAPESDHRCDARSDIYSLGKLFEAMIGPARSPFAELLHKWTHHDPDQRPQSGAELLEWLAQLGRPAALIPARSLWTATLLCLCSLVCLVLGLLPVGPTEPGVSPFLARIDQALLQGDETLARQLAQSWQQAEPDDGLALITAQNLGQPESPVLPIVVPLTGPEWRQARNFLQGAALAQRRVQQQGRPLRLQVCDDQSTIAQSMGWVDRLGADPKIRCLLGPTNSERTLAVELLAARRQLPVVSLGATHPKAWQSDSLFTLGAPFPARVVPLARQLAQRHFSEVWLLYDDQQAMARDLAFVVKGNLGETTVVERTYPTSTRDFSALVDELKGAQAIFFVAAPGSYLGEFARQLRRSGSQAELYSNVVGYSAGLLEAGGDALDGLRLAETFFPESQAAPVKAFVEEFQGQFPGVEPTRAAAQGYDGVTLLEPWLGHSRDQIRHNLRALGSTQPAYIGASGYLSPGKMPAELPVYLLEIRNGRHQLVEDPVRK
ncbi:MAG: ABC transporter substrate-binding protein [Vulcanimicrobiota bacterium]